MPRCLVCTVWELISDAVSSVDPQPRELGHRRGLRGRARPPDALSPLGVGGGRASVLDACRDLPNGLSGRAPVGARAAGVVAAQDRARAPAPRPCRGDAGRRRGAPLRLGRAALVRRMARALRSGRLPPPFGRADRRRAAHGAPAVSLCATTVQAAQGHSPRRFFAPRPSGRLTACKEAVF